MSERPSHNLDGLDIDLARLIHVICRCFEIDWPQRRQPRMEDNLGICRRGRAGKVSHQRGLRGFHDFSGLAKPLDPVPGQCSPHPGTFQ